MTDYLPSDDRYRSMTYRRCGDSGLLLPAVSLGLWQNFGDDRLIQTQRAVLRRAFDLGITHFDLANNYGPPYGSAEINFGRILHEDFREHSDEEICIFLRKDQRRSKLYHVVQRAVRASQNPAISETIDHIGRLIARRQFDSQKQSRTAHIGDDW